MRNVYCLPHSIWKSQIPKFRDQHQVRGIHRSHTDKRTIPGDWCMTKKHNARGWSLLKRVKLPGRVCVTVSGNVDFLHQQQQKTTTTTAQSLSSLYEHTPKINVISPLLINPLSRTKKPPKPSNTHNNNHTRRRPYQYVLLMTVSLRQKRGGSFFLRKSVVI